MYVIRIQTCLATLAQYRASVVIWTLVAGGGGEVGGYSEGEFAAYYLAWILVRHFTVAIRPDTIEKRVSRGEFSPLLMQPVHPIHGDIGDIIALKLFVLPTVVITLVALMIIFPPTFHLEWWSIPAFVITILLAFPIRFLFTWILGLVAFWTTWARSIYGVFTVAEIFLTGRLAPLALLPVWAQLLASFLPFRWMIVFPVEVLIGKVTLDAVLIGVGIQVVVLVVLVLLLDKVWHAAVRRYAAVGG